MYMLPRDPRGGSSHPHSSHGSESSGGGGGGGSSSSASLNTTTYALDVFCAYAVSGPYQLIPRALLYVLLFLAFFSRMALTTVMVYTSIAAIHVCALASHHSLEMIDLDIFPAYNAIVLAMLVAPLLIMLAPPLRGEGRKNLGVVALWMLLLWTGIVSFCASQKYQPPTTPCLDVHGHNVTSNAHISSCTHQRTWVLGPRLPMRSGQLPQLVSKPADFYAGPGRTQHWIIAITVLITVHMFIGFGLAASPPPPGPSPPPRTKKAKKKAKDEASGRLFVLKIGFWGSFAQILFMESAIHHFPVVEGRDGIGQWGPLVGFSLVVLAVVVKMLPEMGKSKPKVAAVGADALKGGGDRSKTVGVDKPGNESVELGVLDRPAVQKPTAVHLTSKSEVVLSLSTLGKETDREEEMALGRRGTF